MEAYIVNLGNDPDSAGNTIVTVEYRDADGTVVSSEDIVSESTETAHALQARISTALGVFKDKYEKQVTLRALLDQPIS